MKLLWILMAYVLGSVPFGLVFARNFCGVDPRTAGSCNVGATNVARLCGKLWGAATLVCDILKGALPVGIALCISDSAFFVTLTALSAVLGHLFSCFLRFRGGKAVATSIGVFLPIAFWPLLLSCGLCLLVIWRSGFVSLGSLSLVTSLPVLLALSGCWQYLPLALAIMALVIWSHRANIQRLICGIEKPWQKKAYTEEK